MKNEIRNSETVILKNSTVGSLKKTGSENSTAGSLKNAGSENSTAGSLKDVGTVSEIQRDEAAVPVPEVSIIIPVYNAEEHLRKCVDSVLQQEFTDFELILVDDCSRDESGKICDDYAQQDHRVRVYHNPHNMGVSATRNFAIEHARGTYLQFIDADDWISPEATKLLVRTASEGDCDMVIADFYRVVGERISAKGDIDTDHALTRQDYAEFMMKNPADFYYGVLWNKLFCRSIIMEHNIRMDTSLSWCEDFIFNMEYVLYCRSIKALLTPVYYYVRTEGSLVSQGASMSGTVRMKLTVIEYYDNFYKNILSAEEYSRIKPEISRFMLDWAGDGSALPIVDKAKKLGSESVSVLYNPAMDDRIFCSRYYKAKLYERYYRAIALENELEPEDVKILELLLIAEHESHADTQSDGERSAAGLSRQGLKDRQSDEKRSAAGLSRQEMEDYLGIPSRSIGAGLRRLERRNLISQETLRFCLPAELDSHNMTGDGDSEEQSFSLTEREADAEESEGFLGNLRNSLRSRLTTDDRGGLRSLLTADDRSGVRSRTSADDRGGLRSRISADDHDGLYSQPVTDEKTQQKGEYGEAAVSVRDKKEHREKKERVRVIVYHLTPQAQKITQSLKERHRDFENVCFRGMTQTQILQYRELSDMTIANVKKSLLPERTDRYFE